MVLTGGYVSDTAKQDPQDRMKHIFLHPDQFDRQRQVNTDIHSCCLDCSHAVGSTARGIQPGLSFSPHGQAMRPASSALQAFTRRHIIACQNPRHLVPSNAISQVYCLHTRRCLARSCPCQLSSSASYVVLTLGTFMASSSHCLPCKPQIGYRIRLTRKPNTVRG